MDDEIKNKIDNRKEFNRYILITIARLIDEYPEQRFGQLIANYIFPNYRERDFFYEESVDTFNKIRELHTIRY